MKKVKCSAPGKLMLFGEHAVVHGRPCIVTAVDQRMYVQAELNGKDELVVNAPQLGIQNYHKTVKELCNQEMPKQVSFIEAVVKRFYEKYGLDKGLNITTHSEFSHTYGFGSSSGVTVATVQALSVLYNIKLSKKQIFKLGYQAVLDIQKVGSGFDLAAALWGKILYFKKGAEVVEEIKVDKLPLVVCYSGIKADTPTLVEQVNEFKRRDPQKVNNLFDQMREIANQAKKLIPQSKWNKLGNLMDKNQLLLEQLGVSTYRLENLIKAAKNAGALGAKLSGAGGGDCIIALVKKSQCSVVEKALKKAGGQIMKVKLNSRGVECQQI